jgi:hypothetical protein
LEDYWAASSPKRFTFTTLFFSDLGRNGVAMPKIPECDRSNRLFLQSKGCLANRSIYFGLPPQDGNFSTTFPDS